MMGIFLKIVLVIFELMYFVTTSESKVGTMDRMRVIPVRYSNIFIMNTYIFILFQSLGRMALLVDRPVPETIRNPVAIKLLVSGLLA